MKNVLVLFVLLISGCAPIATFDLSDEVKMDVYSMDTDEASFEIQVKFSESTRFHDIIQEGRIDNGNVFVEKFSADDRTGTDTHFSDRNTTPETRILTVYVGNTAGTGNTWSGFAMLPQNMDGSTVTNTGLNFNRRYRQDFPVLTGVITERSKIQGQWTIIWRPHYLEIQTPSGKLINRKGVISKN